MLDSLSRMQDHISRKAMALERDRLLHNSTPAAFTVISGDLLSFARQHRWLALRVIDPHAAHDLKYALTAVTAGLPAVATASYGIRVILDFAGIAARSKRIAATLRASLAAWIQTPPSAAALQEFTPRAADVMLGDVAAWRLLADGSRLTIPG